MLKTEIHYITCIRSYMYNSLKYEIHYKWDGKTEIHYITYQVTYVQFVEIRNTLQVGWDGMAKN